MRGADRSEHTRALQFCIILVWQHCIARRHLDKAVILSAQTLANKTVGILGLLGKAVYNARQASR